MSTITPLRLTNVRTTLRKIKRHLRVTGVSHAMCDQPFAHLILLKRKTCPVGRGMSPLAVLHKVKERAKERRKPSMVLSVVMSSFFVLHSLTEYICLKPCLFFTCVFLTFIFTETPSYPPTTLLWRKRTTLLLCFSLLHSSSLPHRIRIRVSLHIVYPPLPSHIWQPCV